MSALAVSLTPPAASWLPGLEVIRAEQARRLLVREPHALAQRAGIVLDSWQQRIVESPVQAMLINCSRQAGKSTAVALVIVRQMLLSDQLVLVIAPSLRQTKELMRKVLMYWRRFGRLIPHTHVTRTTLELENGSRLEALPGKSDTIVGFSAVNLLVIDEAARVPDELYSSVAPMLAVSHGRLLAPSTPHGKRGWWYDLWRDISDGDIERVEVPAPEVSRISPEFLARERRRIGDWWFAQEYLCQFLEAQSAAFREADVEAMFRPDVPRADWLFAE